MRQHILYSPQFDGLGLGVGLENCQTANQFLGLGEGAIGDGGFAVGSADACTEARGHAAFGAKQPATLHSLADHLAHGRHFFW